MKHLQRKHEISSRHNAYIHALHEKKDPNTQTHALSQPSTKPQEKTPEETKTGRLRRQSAAAFLDRILDSPLGGEGGLLLEFLVVDELDVVGGYVLVLLDQPVLDLGADVALDDDLLSARGGLCDRRAGGKLFAKVL